MDRTITSSNIKYYRLVQVTSLILIANLFLPFINLKEKAVSMSAFDIFLKSLQFFELFGDNKMLGIIIILTVLSPILTLLASLLALIIPKKPVLTISAFSYLFSALSATIVLFTVAKAVNGSGLLDTAFLVKYLGTGYWLFLILSYVGLTFAMLTIRVSPGYIVLTILSIIWLIPIAWVIMISFREEPGAYTSYFFPKKFTLNNYVVLLTDTSKFHYLKWFGNTLFVSVCSCLLTTLIVLSTSYTLSRLRFPGRKTFMNILLILGMFPGFMSMIAVYYILKGLGITQSLTALIMVYSGGAALSYYVAKGFFDTIPRALDEAAYIDGATKWYVFTRITIPLSKPIIIYTMLVAFIAPWCDYIFASVIMGDKYENYTIALGLYLMLDRTNITKWYTRFAAGAVLVSIPISILFIALQKYYTASITGSVKG